MTDERVRYIFNQMAAQYDDLRDLWYAWLFSRLHFLIAKHLISGWSEGMAVLDVGCGTGLQSFLYALSGARVTGVDISDELLAVALEKATFAHKKFPVSLFSPHFRFVEKYNKRISDLLRPRFKSTEYVLREHAQFY